MIRKCFFTMVCVVVLSACGKEDASMQSGIVDQLTPTTSAVPESSPSDPSSVEGERSGGLPSLPGGGAPIFTPPKACSAGSPKLADFKECLAGIHQEMERIKDIQRKKMEEIQEMIQAFRDKIVSPKPRG